MPIIGGRQIGVRGLGFQGAGKPSVPTSVSATDVGTARAFNNGAADVTWSAPSSNGAPISSYTVLSSPGGYTATTSSTSVQVTGLQSDIAYTFTVTATNAVGTSDASSASASITATTVPQAPTIGTATAGNASATVAYTAGATGGKAISTFTATSSPGSLTGTGTSPITVSGLTNGTAYTFTVTATNANGTSSASAASNSVTPVLPSSYESIASSSGSGSSSVTFSNIPNTYKMLQLRMFISDNTNTDQGVFITFNGGSIDQVSSIQMGGRGSTASTSAGTTGQGNGVYIRAFGTAEIGAPAILDFYDYATTTKFKTFDLRNGFVSANAGDADSSYKSSVYNSINPISSITLTSQTSTFRSTNSFALYGIK
jgi:hypothetical protein